MKDKWKQWLKHPPILISISTWIMTIVFLFLCIFYNIKCPDAWWIYILDVLILIFSVYTIYTVVYLIKNFKEIASKHLKEGSFTHRIVNDYIYRSYFFALMSALFDIVYAIFNFVIFGLSNFDYASIWYGAIAAYFLCLGIIRAYILIRTKLVNNKTINLDDLHIKELKIYITTGVLFLVLDIYLSVFVGAKIRINAESTHGVISTITSAAYTFIKVIVAIYSYIKTRKMKKPVAQAIKALNITDASVSLLNLEITMIALFSDEDTDDQSMIIVKFITAIAVCALTIILGLIMIIEGSIKLKKSRSLKGN